MIVAIVEAKDENKDPLIGLKQAKNYCIMLEVKNLLFLPMDTK